MIYELRIYHMFPGRMEAINRRFANVTLGLFEKHGVRVVDFWEDAQGREVLYYVLEFDDLEAKKSNWEAFVADPEWIAAKSASEADGRIVERVESYLMTRVPYFSNA